jgi:hypothetical protein
MAGLKQPDCPVLVLGRLPLIFPEAQGRCIREALSTIMRRRECLDHIIIFGKARQRRYYAPARLTITEIGRTEPRRTVWIRRKLPY